MTPIHSLDGMRCRPKPSGRPPPMVEYYYEVIASALDANRVMWCWVISSVGQPNVLPFMDLEFEPKGVGE